MNSSAILIVVAVVLVSQKKNSYHLNQISPFYNPKSQWNYIDPFQRFNHDSQDAYRKIGKIFNTDKPDKYLPCVYVTVFLLLLFSPEYALAKVTGAYTGQVLDSRTGEPIRGASIFVLWIGFTPHVAGGNTWPIKAHLVYTDDKGFYRIPRQFLNTKLIEFFQRTELIIYQPGYQALTAKNQQGETPEFTERNAIVKLERVPPGFDHKAHHERMTNFPHSIYTHYVYSTGTGNRKAGSIKESIKRNVNFVAYGEFLRRIEWEK